MTANFFPFYNIAKPIIQSLFYDPRVVPPHKGGGDDTITGGGGNPGGGGGVTPVFNADFIANPAVPSGFSFARTNSEWGFDSNGLLISVAANTPLFDHLVSSGISRGFACQINRINRCLWSRDLTNAVWVSTNASVVLNGIDLDGTPDTGCTVTVGANLATILQTISDAVSRTRRFSVYIKRVSGAGTVELTLDNGTTWTDVTAQLNGTSYARIASGQVVISPTIGFRFGTSGDVFTIDVCQLEDTSSITSDESSPIITTSSTVSRSVGSMTGLFSGYNSSVGTFYAEFEPISLFGTNQAIIELNNGTVQNRIGIYGNSGHLQGMTNVANVGKVNITDGTFNLGTNKCAFAYDVANGLFKMSLNGSILSSTAGLPDMTTMTQHRIGSSLINSGTPAKGWLRKVSYYDSVFADTDLQTLTT